jgi:hypothetical protein
MRGRSCRAEQGLQMGRERRGAKGSHVSGWQGTTTRTSPDRDKRPGDVERSRCRMLLGQSRISALGRACGRGRCDWDGRSQGRSARPLDGHKHRCPEGFRPEPKTGGAHLVKEPRRANWAAVDSFAKPRWKRCLAGDSGSEACALVILCFAQDGLQQATSGSTRRCEASTCNSSTAAPSQ